MVTMDSASEDILVRARQTGAVGNKLLVMFVLQSCCEECSRVQEGPQ